jgi:DNA-binding NarL/FixJ family response regulator
MRAIVIVTQHDDAELEAAATEAGARGYMLKDDLLKLRTFLKTTHNC